MRNNEDRMGLDTSNDNLQPSHEPVTNNNQIEFIVPTEIVELPTKGLFYEEGHPLYMKEEVEIRHMTTKEEDILTNKSFIKNGTAVDRLIKSVLITPGVNVKDIYNADKDAILVSCRIHGYGSDYKTQFACPSCGTRQNHEFDLEDVENKDFNSALEEFDATVDYASKTFGLTIPRTKTKLELRLIKGDEEQSKKSKNSQVISKQYKKIIKAVNGNSDPRYINSYINSMSALDSRYLRAAYAKITPGVDFSCHFECNNCGFEDTVEVPLNAEFFWPKS